jgi:O-antigen/teichoic acid export membrane protein
MANIQQSATKEFISRAVGSILSFVGIAIFARNLTTSELGVYFLFQMMIGLLALPGSFGRGNAIIKRISEDKIDSSRVLSTGIGLLIVSNAVLAISVYGLRGVINSYIGSSVAVWLAIGIVLRSIHALGINTLRGELRVGEAATVTLFQRLSWLAVGYTLMQYGYREEALIFGLLSSYLVSLAVSAYKISISLGKPSIELAESLVGYWKYTTVSFVDSQLYNWADVALIGFFLSQSSVGIYEVAWRITVVVTLFSTSIENVILPQISSWDSTKSREKIQHLLPNALLASAIIPIPALFGTVLLSEDILRILFGDAYTEGSLVLIVLMAGKIIEAIDRVSKNFLDGTNLPHLRMYAVTVSIVSNVALNAILIDLLGIVGAALGTTIAFSMSTLLTVYYVDKTLNFELPTYSLGWCVLTSGIMYVILRLVKSHLKITDILSLLAVVLLGAIIYSAGILIYRPIREKVLLNAKQVFIR